MDEKLKEVLADVFELRAPEVTESLSKDDVDGWDSLTQMDLVTSLEKAYDLRLEMMDIIAMTSVQSIMDVLKAKGVDVEG